MSEIGRRERNVLEIVKALDPDFIFLTGDYVHWDGNYSSAITFLSLLRAKVGIWAIMGDYDYSTSRKSCLFCHEEGSGEPTRKYSVKFLKDHSDVVPLSNGNLIIVGLDWLGGSHLFVSKKSSIDLPGKHPTIILSHSPLNYELVGIDRDVLILAGDTHGGQIPLPKWLFSAMGYTKNARYNEGYFQNGGKKMYVSRGIGTSHVPIRLFRRPEVVVFHFQK